MLYDYCAQSNVPHRKTGKLVVTRANQRAYIESLHNKAQNLKWPPNSPPHDSDTPVAPTSLISGDEAREMEPDLSKDIVAALWSPETGIVDSHTLMESLHKDITDSERGNAAVVLSTKVVRVDPYEGSRQATGSADVEASEGGWIVQTVTGDSQESDSLLVRNLINTSGLSGNLVLNSLLPIEDRIAMYFARGSVSHMCPSPLPIYAHSVTPVCILSRGWSQECLTPDISRTGRFEQGGPFVPVTWHTPHHGYARQHSLRSGP
jgi:2-hydroxyglutarate dehydrogenase